MTQRIFVFKTKETSPNGKPYLLAIPENQITELRSIVGGQNVDLMVNGTRVNASFNSLIDALGEKVVIF